MENRLNKTVLKMGMPATFCEKKAEKGESAISDCEQMGSNKLLDYM